MRAVAGGKWPATATGTCNDDCGKLTITVTYEKLLQEGGHSFGARLLVGAGCSLYGRKPTSRNRSLTPTMGQGLGAKAAHALATLGTGPRVAAVAPVAYRCLHGPALGERLR